MREDKLRRMLRQWADEHRHYCDEHRDNESDEDPAFDDECLRCKTLVLLKDRDVPPSVPTEPGWYWRGGKPVQVRRIAGFLRLWTGHAQDWGIDIKDDGLWGPKIDPPK